MRFGMEKESLVFDHNFNPYQLDEGIFDDNTTLDFCDHQLELVSNVCDSIEELHQSMNYLALNKYPQDGYVWPISPINCNLDYTLNHPKLDDKAYHHHLAANYDVKMLLTSGIHFNVSGFSSSLIDMTKKIYTYAPLILPFFSFSPLKDSNVLSSRNTNKWGYYNEQNLDLDFSSLKAYNKSIDEMINQGKLSARRELYGRVRIKYDEYLELRFIDLNPNYLIGISYEGLKLLECLINYLDHIEINNFDFKECVANFDLVAMEGNNLDLELTIDDVTDTLYNHMIGLLNNFSEYQPEIIHKLINDFVEGKADYQLFNQELAEYDYEICNYAKEHVFYFKQYIDHYPNLDMELSTKILMEAAQKRNFKVEVLSELDNIISINDRLVVQATKTNVDHYADIIMLENKYMTKYLLDKKHIRTPQGIVIRNSSQTKHQDWLNKAIVIKPLDTNFGLGISILPDTHTEAQFNHALELAFSHSNQVIIEEFISGLEYRFLVIDDECVSIIHREACNVIGDGVHTISQLIDIKNQNPLRGEHYNRPVEKIKIDEEMIDILSEQQLTLDCVIPSNQKIYLRKNSNISTGGDSFEMSDFVPQYFKDVAVNATKALNVKICGIDMIIPNLYDYEFGIIEANFNPAIHIHTYPYYGIGKTPSENVLNLLIKDTNH